MNFKGLWWLVDGYSLFYHLQTAPCGAIRFESLRAQLVQRIGALLPGPHDRMTLVFDGRGETLEPAPEADDRLEILYAPAYRTADAVIERMVAVSSAPDRIVVVTSDRTERDIVSAFGARVQSCAGFVETLQQSRAETDLTLKQLRIRAPGRKLGDYFPDPR